MLDEPKQNLRHRAASLARGHQIYVQWSENSRHLTQCLRKTATVDKGLMQRMRHLLNARLLQTLSQNRQRFIERHPRLQQMRELLGENEQLPVRDFQVLRGRGEHC